MPWALRLHRPHRCHLSTCVHLGRANVGTAKVDIRHTTPIHAWILSKTVRGPAQRWTGVSAFRLPHPRYLKNIILKYYANTLVLATATRVTSGPRQPEGRWDTNRIAWALRRHPLHHRYLRHPLYHLPRSWSVAAGSWLGTTYWGKQALNSLSRRVSLSADGNTVAISSLADTIQTADAYKYMQRGAILGR